MLGYHTAFHKSLSNYKMFTSNANFEVSVALKDSQNSAVLNDCIHVFIKITPTFDDKE